jgi:Flagellar protein FlhE
MHFFDAVSSRLLILPLAFALCACGASVEEESTVGAEQPTSASNAPDEGKAVLVRPALVTEKAEPPARLFRMAPGGPQPLVADHDSANNAHGPTNNTVTAYALSSGTWTANARGPNMNYSGRWYTSGYITNYAYSVPSNATITEIFWAWSTYNNSYTSEMIVYLCTESGSCLDVSTDAAAATGTTMAFNGMSAHESFQFWFGIPGSGGSLSPAIWGGDTKLYVDWATP